MGDFESQKKKVRDFKQGINETLGIYERLAVDFKDFERNIAPFSDPDYDERLRQELDSIIPLLNDQKKIITEMENLILSAEKKIADTIIVELRPKQGSLGARQRMPLVNDLSQDSAIFSADSTILRRESAGIHPSDESSPTSSSLADEPMVNELRNSSSDEDYNANH
ncbi:uncharacterized protein LOC127847838 isoform X1 [Dreissena polymorpha]|uniref:Uncharacterized protein n=1 Tax=Dreissena polymorpha TaxID=45954 RepID=A0A9D4I3L8_DREPO|nr:uncharacterized protein LOC127847838 isoform X1 [Dreissena polymorpha]KAH3746920.1 hypothetical protein DPMN_181338 [Dreissena polymorpha]